MWNLLGESPQILKVRYAKFHLSESVSPLRGEKPQIAPDKSEYRAACASRNAGSNYTGKGKHHV